MDTRAFYRMVRERLNGLGIEDSKRVTAVVLRALRDRLTRDEAEQVAAQLPRPLKEVWTVGDRPGRRPLKIRRDELLQRVKHEAGLLSGEAARRLTEAVFAALKAQLSPGEADDVWAQLLDLDSMDVLNLMIGLHHAFGVDIPESDYPKLATLEGCVEHLASLAGSPPNKESVR